MNEPELEKLGRVLAVDVRSRWVAFATLGASAQLLDFGASRFRSASAAKARFLFVLELLHPSIIVFRRISPGDSRSNPRTRKVAGVLRCACHRLSLQVLLLSGAHVRRCFKERGAKTKQQIASVLAQDFPALAWKLPPPRENYDHEHWNMPIFDAVAIGVAYFSNAKENPPTFVSE